MVLFRREGFFGKEAKILSRGSLEVDTLFITSYIIE